MKALLRSLFLFCLLAVAAGSQAQYYYKDIIGSNESNQMIKNYLANNVKRVALVSYEGDGTKTEDFNVSQLFSAQEQKMTTITRTGDQESFLTTVFNKDGNVVKTIDSSILIVTTSSYNYNSDQQLTSLSSRSVDSSRNFEQVEEHRWEYASGKPVKMTKHKNGKLTETVKFKVDENGNVIEEQSFIGDIGSEPVQYFYDAKGRLTDIVRFNPRAKKLLPEYLFEYSSTNQVLQKITVPANSSNYLIWRYQYDDRGLKIREAVFDKQKRMNGKVEYMYSF